MRVRELGKTGLKVSEIGLGGEWLERHNTEEVKEVVDACAVSPLCPDPSGGGFCDGRV